MASTGDHTAGMAKPLWFRADDLGGVKDATLWHPSVCPHVLGDGASVQTPAEPPASCKWGEGWCRIR